MAYLTRTTKFQRCFSGPQETIGVCSQANEQRVSSPRDAMTLKMPKECRAGKRHIHIQHLCLLSWAKQDISTPTTSPALKIWLVSHPPATQIFQCPFDYSSTFLAMISCKGKFMTWPKQTTVTTAYLCSTAGESPCLNWGEGCFWHHHLLFYFCSILGISFVGKQKQSASHPFWQEQGSNCSGTNKYGWKAGPITTLEPPTQNSSNSIFP